MQTRLFVYPDFENNIQICDVLSAYLYLTGPKAETALQYPVDKYSLHVICNLSVR
jgi:hypothetical protein